MTPDEWRNAAIAHLDQLAEQAVERWATEQPDAYLYGDLLIRFGFAAQAFPGMNWEEFLAVEGARHRKRGKGRPLRSVITRAEQKIWLAARDADEIKKLWRALNCDAPRSRPPVHPHEIAGQRHGYTKQEIDLTMRRPNSRRLDRIAAAQK